MSEAEFERLAGVQLSVHWDGGAEPAIDLPLRELFASGNTLPARSNFTLAATTQAGVHTLSLRLPMPFSERAQWSFRQTGTTPATFEVEWLGVDGAPRGPFGRRHVQRVETPLPTMHLEQPVASVSGRGRYVGLCADVAGDAEVSLGTLSAGPLNILEGDFRAIADGNLVLDGTGAEDYPDNSIVRLHRTVAYLYVAP